MIVYNMLSCLSKKQCPDVHIGILIFYEAFEDEQIRRLAEKD